MGVLLLCLSTMPAQAECPETSARMVQRHTQQAAQIDADLRASMQSAMARSKADLADAQIDQIEQSSRRALRFSKRRYDTVDTVIDYFETFHTKPEDQDLCSTPDKIERFSDDRLAQYRAVSEAVAEEFERRLSLFELAPNEGLVTIATHAYSYAQVIELFRPGIGGKQFGVGPLQPDSQFFQVVKLREGTYRWGRVEFQTRHFFDFRGNRLQFDVAPGVLNYVGVFEYRRLGPAAMGEIVDRTSVILTMLEQQYPELVDHYRLHNGWLENDPFIDFYLSERRKERSQ